MTVLRAVDGPDRLGELAAVANAEHREAGAKGLEMLEHAIRCGEALLEARGLVERGSWLDWMEQHVEIHPTTAYRYMRVAEHRDQVRRSGAESIEGAMRLLADLPRRGHGPRGYSEADKAQWLRLVEQFGVKRTAKALGIAPSTIWKWTRGPDAGTAGAADRTYKAAVPKDMEITDDVIDVVGSWLCKRFSDAGYFATVNDQVRADALELVGVLLEAA